MSEFIPDPKTVKQQICPGIWLTHENDLHFDAETFMKWKGLPVSATNILIIEEAFKQAARQANPRATIIDLFDKEPLK